LIVATAGHVDHGKTSLVRALTGVDTDRLPEEKRRGMSIDLGFAYHGPLAFVDVPGHERFVRNMAAGVTGIDLALLVVAADDGPMPQTREHLAILEHAAPRILGVLSKIDRVARTCRAGRGRVGNPWTKVASRRGDLRASRPQRDGRAARAAGEACRASVAKLGAALSCTGSRFHHRRRRARRHGHRGVGRGRRRR
jgi:small GTP-binding protein